MRYKVIDDCPAPRALYPVLLKLKHGVNRKLHRPLNATVYNSLLRSDAVEGLLHRHGKHTQRELYEAFQAGHGLPANPPDRGTHILLGDGTVGVLHAKLPFWRLGIDSDFTPELIDVARGHGWRLYRPYNTSSEYHHVNFAEPPTGWRKLLYRLTHPKRRKK
jgi:hypothetical protein